MSNSERGQGRRRVVDIALSSFLLAATSPVMIVISIWIKSTSPGPVLHRAQRVGRNGGTFMLYKFRS
ncbi:MAG: sugar transferase, partial [Actinomycetota bacterium]